MKRGNGFTLIEMAALLVLLGIMVAALIGLYTWSFAGKVTQTQVNTSARGARTIVAFAQMNKYLPESKAVLNTLWRDNDTFGNSYEYIIAPELINRHNVCSIPDTTALTARYCETADCSSMSAPTDNVAFILLSYGRNGAADYTIQGNEYRFLRKAEAFDDIPTYYTVAELKGLIGCEVQATDENRLRFANSDLVPLIINGSTSAAAVIVANGGTTFGGGQYDWCVDDFEPFSANFYALDMLFYVQSSGSSVPLNRIADSNCAVDTFTRGGNILSIKYGKPATTNGAPALFYFTAHLKDNNGAYIKKRYLFQMYQN